MKSRILIDLDENNQPVININFEPSDDIRDRLVQQFIENVRNYDGAQKAAVTIKSLDAVGKAGEFTHKKLVTISPIK